MSYSTVSLNNGVRISLQSSPGGFLGLGEVRCGDVTLRSARRPMFVEIRNPSGIELCEYQVLGCKPLDDGVSLTFAAKRRPSWMEWMLHTVRNRYNTADWTQPPTPADNTRLSLDLRAVSRTIGNAEYRGFSYQYRYRSDDIPIYKILDRGTWEIGAKAVGNSFWLRNCFAPSIVPISDAAQHYSSEWYQPDCHNPNIFQFLPFQTQFQGFTFTAAAEGVLVTWATRVAHIRSLFEKQPTSDEIVHFHEHCGDLAKEFASVPMEVLFCPCDADRIQLANMHEHVREMVYTQLHTDIHMRQERTGTYGQIEEWGTADIPQYTSQGVPKLLGAGIRHIELANHFQNNMNTWGVSNMCCTVDYKVAESVGAGNLKSLIHAANAGGASVGMWGNTAISTLTWLFDKRVGNDDRIRFLPEPGSIMETLAKSDSSFVRNPSGAIEADHYTPVFAVLNLRAPQVRDYWLKSWKQAHDDLGLAGIFLDSSSNLSSDKFHFVQNAAVGSFLGVTPDQTHLTGRTRPAAEAPAAIQSQYLAHLELIGAMQRMGYKYVNEDLGVFGLHRHGPSLETRLDNLFLWSDCIACFDVPTLEACGADLQDVYFRALAYQLMWSIFWIPGADKLSFHYGGVRGDFDIPTAWHLSLLRVFNEVSDLLHNRHILPEERGVCYRQGDSQILWAFADLELRLDCPRNVQDVLSGMRCETGRLRARKYGVYRIDCPQACGPKAVAGMAMDGTLGQDVVL